MPLVTLTTDFGTRDPYVAAMKGVLAAWCPEAHVIDLTHQIGPQDLIETALFLAATTPLFPESTIHIAVVDPGVGTDRRAIIAKANNQYYVCPDNGILTVLLQNYPLQAAHAITNPGFMRDEISDTFHGRDIFAPAAGRIANGTPLSEAGPVAENIETLGLSDPVVERDRVTGTVVHVDRFGNCITNIRRNLVTLTDACEIHSGNHVFRGIARTYGQVPKGSPLALFGSMNLLELAVSQGSAAAILHMERGTEVTVVFPRQ